MEAKWLELSILDQDGNKTYYKVDPNKKMQALFRQHCKQQHVDYKPMKFLCNGRRINAAKTPMQNGLERGDEITMWVELEGGGNIINSGSII